MASRPREFRASSRQSHCCPHRGRKRQRGLRLAALLTGLGALIWVLFRVVPRPYRASYPCQQVALPLAGGFLVWVIHVTGSLLLLRAGQRFLARPHRGAAIICLALAAAVGATALLTTGEDPAQARDDPPNEPIGVARGIHPGRVCWIHDPEATDWQGPGDGHWWEPAHTAQAAVDGMMTQALLGLSGEVTEAAAWDGVFRYFNQTHGHGDFGYAPGEKIVIKVNFVGLFWSSNTVNPTTYDLVDRLNYPNTSPQMILALLRQLVDVVGVNQADISVGDPTALFANQYHDYLHDVFPDVQYLDHDGGNASHARAQVQFSTIPVFWSGQSGHDQDYVPVSFAEAKYLINFANFKSHMGAGVTLGAKNHYGSLIRRPNQSGYYDLHESLAYLTPATGQYRALVDLLGHDHIGGQTLLSFVDGLYSGVHPDDDVPRRWDFPPFSGDWTSSLFVSQDPVAIESVCFDFMQEEGDPRQYPQIAGADDYLHEAAMADSPASGSFYDPNHSGDVQRLSGLGAHEHWNNSTDKQYSRNLGAGEGIELLIVEPTAVADPGIGPASVPPGNLALTVYPNPFNPATVIRYSLPKAARVRVRVYDLTGRVVRTLLDERQGEGTREVRWDAGSDDGHCVASGTYFIRVEAGQMVASKKMVLLP